jgi:general stress protein 26
MSSKDNNNLTTTTLLLFATIPLVYFVKYNYSIEKKLPSSSSVVLEATNTTTTKSLSSSINDGGQHIRPPFPPIIRQMLSSCRLAYLSTVEEDSSHLSLMRFTYINDATDGEVIIMTTRRKTKKFNMLQKQNGVALLIHDFPQFKKMTEGEEDKEGEVVGDGNGDGDGVHSITLNGQCVILQDGERAEMYRAKHLEHNPDYPQFIVGEDISVLCVNITSARICNINDQVTRWSVKDSV